MPEIKEGEIIAKAEIEAPNKLTKNIEGSIKSIDKLKDSTVKTGKAINESLSMGKVTKEVANLAKQEQELHRVQQEIIKSQSKLGQGFKEHGEIFTKLSPQIGKVTEGINSATKASLRFLATPIGAIIAIIAAGVALLVKSVSVFFDETLEGQEKLNELSSYYTAIQAQIDDQFKAIGKSIIEAFDNPEKLKEWGINILEYIVNPFKAAGDAVSYFAEQAEEVRKKQEIALEIAKLTNALVREHIKDVVDDANTELRVNELLEKSKDKLNLTDKDRLKALRAANVLLKEQLKGDIELAKGDLEAAEKKIKLNGGIIQQNKLLSEYTDDELRALNVNKNGIDELAAKQIALIKVQSDASVKRKGFLKLEAALQEEIDKAERDRQERLINAERSNRQLTLNENIKTNQEIIDNDESTLQQQEDAFKRNTNLKRQLLEVDRENQLSAIRKTAEDRIRAEGIYDEIEIFKRLEADESYRIQKETINREYDDKEYDLLIAQFKGIKDIYEKGYQDLAKTSKEGADERLKALNDEFVIGNVSVANYEKERKNIVENSKKQLLLAELQFLKDKVKALNGDQSVAVQEKIAQLEVAIAQDSADKQLEIKKQLNQKLNELEQRSFDFAITLSQNVAAAETQRLDNRLHSLKDHYDKDLEAAGDNEALKEKLQRKFAAEEKRIDEEKAKIKRKQAIFEKAIAITRATVNTAVAVTANLEVPLLAAAIAALGALEIAAIASQPIPSYAVGTEYHRGGLAQVGEKGSELAVTPSGKLIFTPNHTSIMDLPKGTKVYDNDKTMRMLALSALRPSDYSPIIAHKDTIIVNELRKMNNKISTGSNGTGLVRSFNDLWYVKKSHDGSVKLLRDMSMGKWY